jgi:uncharacterized membrane protein YdfJ with MMPL/SSD domain
MFGTRHHSHTTGRSNLAGRMGRWSAAHWKTATFGWLAMVVVAFGLGGMVGMKNIDANTPGPGESGRVDRILDAGFKQPAGESVLIQSSTLRAGDPEFTAAVRDVVAAISKLGIVQHVRSPLAPGNGGQIAPNGHAALVELQIRGDPDTAVDRIGPVLDRVAALQKAHPQLFIGEFGDASKVDALVTAYGNDLGKAGLLSLPVTLIILLVAFGALVAAGIPLLLALTAVFATFGLISLPSHVFPVAMQAPALVLLIGLAVGVDYSMFYLKREREERAAGRSEQAALEAAAATSGRSVLIAGLTVIVAMAGMFLTGDPTFESLGVAAITVVAIAVLGSLTVLPALLSRLGDRVDRGRVPLIGRVGRSGGEGRIWGAIIDRVLRRPALFLTVATGLLLVAAIPAFSLHIGASGVSTLPDDLASKQGYEALQRDFPAESTAPAYVVAGDSSADVRQRLRGLQQRLASDPRFGRGELRVGSGAAALVVPVRGDKVSDAAVSAVRDLRNNLVPQAFAGTETPVHVGGETSENVDYFDAVTDPAPLVFAFVLGLTLILLTVAFRSIVVALSAIALNLLSVGAAYGLLVLVFLHGYGTDLFGFEKVEAIDAWVPLFLFSVLFGLSMDYQVFLLSRIRERYDRTQDTRDAVRWGVASTARIITGAALIIVAVFLGFARGDLVMFQQMGFGVAVSLLIDATIIRSVILPSLMAILGERNWYLPRWLEWIPHMEIEGRTAPTPP